MFSKKLFDEIFMSKAENRLLIVPAQLTLSAEQAAFDYSKKDVFFDFHVMSGNRLRREILARTEGPGRTAISSLGRQMMLRRIAKEIAPQLKIYKASAASSDFLRYTGDFIVQMKQTNPEGLELGSLADEGSLLSGKLHDMSLFSGRYEEAMRGKYIDSEDGLLFAAEKAYECGWLKGCEFWFAGFYSFTKREKLFLNALKENSLGLHVYYSAPKDDGRFHMPQGADRKLQGLYTCSDPYGQALSVASEILRLVREEGMTAEDIAVLSADVSSDSKMMKRVFDALEIPLFADEKRSLMHLKGPALLSALLDMAADGMRADLVSSFIDDDDFSNYVKSYRPKGKAFMKPFKYGGADKIAAEIRRGEFADLTSGFFESFAKAETLRDKTSVLYDFAENSLKLPEKFEEEALALSEDGYFDAAEELRQCWGIIGSVFDEAVELAGDIPIDAGEYRDLIKDAFKDVQLGLLPQKSGCVIFGDLYRTKLSGIKALFITSFADGYVPRSSSGRGILDDADEKELLRKGVVLCKSYETLLSEDRANIYEAFDAPSDKLYLYMSASDAAGSSLKPSNLLLQMGEVKKYDAKEPSLQSKAFAMELLPEALRARKLEGKELAPEYKTAAFALRGDKRFEAMKKGLLYRNEEKTLSKAKIGAVLHPEYTGPSALELYARCPFAYFMRHGLKPEEPVDFTVSKRNIGDIHHEILMRLSGYLSSDGKAVRDPSSLWMTVSDDEVRAKVLDIAKQIADEDASGLYKKGGEEEYRLSRVCSVASRFALEMISQVRTGNIDRIECEKEFILPFGNTTIKGKIDRVDITDLPDEELVKIVDYKSGAVSFNKDLIEKGLAVQLMIYLESESRKGEKPVGSFYFHIADPEFKTDSVSIMLSELSEAGAEKIRESFKLDGAYTNSPEALASLDKYMGQDGKSKVVKKTQQMSEEDFEKLREAFREKLTENIEALSKGNVSVRPKKLGTNFTSCTYCEYRSVCAFDRQNEGFRYE